MIIAIIVVFVIFFGIVTIADANADYKLRAARLRAQRDAQAKIAYKKAHPLIFKKYVPKD